MKGLVTTSTAKGRSAILLAIRVPVSDSEAMYPCAGSLVTSKDGSVTTSPLPESVVVLVVVVVVVVVCVPLDVWALPKGAERTSAMPAESTAMRMLGVFIG